ncbi:hypothetical protein BGW38_004637, partial [Lunasporangiospora selenospora]
SKGDSGEACVCVPVVFCLSPSEARRGEARSGQEKSACGRGYFTLSCNRDTRDKDPVISQELTTTIRPTIIMSSIVNVLRSAPTPTRHFTSLNVVTSAKQSFNPEHHPIVLQQLVDSLKPNAYLSSISPAPVASGSASTNASAAANSEAIAAATAVARATLSSKTGVKP